MTDPTRPDLAHPDLTRPDSARPDLGLLARDGSACRCASHAAPAPPAAAAAQPSAFDSAHDAGAQAAAHEAVAHAAAHAAAAPVEYSVTGMTCAHCVASVTEEVSAIDGIDSVTVQLNVGGESLVSVRGAAAADRAAVAAAVDEAGYALAGE